MIGLAFQHGWGYGPEAWATIASAFPDHPVALLDAGYRGAPKLSIPENSDGWIGVGHSLGFARLLALRADWRGLIGFGAFLRFCRLPGREGGTPPEIIDAMLQKLAAQPAEVLRRFTRRCGREEALSVPTETAPCERLRADLRLLRTIDASAPTAPPVLLIHAADDRIVPVSLATEAEKALGGHLEILDAGGHALPFNRPDDCIRSIREFLRGRE